MIAPCSEDLRESALKAIVLYWMHALALTFESEHFSVVRGDIKTHTRVLSFNLGKKYKNWQSYKIDNIKHLKIL